MSLSDVLREQGFRLETWDAERHSRYRFAVSRDGAKVGEGTHFTGGRRIAPWIEFHPSRKMAPETGTDRALFTAFSAVLRPGSHLMVHYLEMQDDRTALNADVPPPATRIGFLMWEAGFRWFKDWYFTEGWMEGTQKLQGNLPVDEEQRREREAEMEERLSAFLENEDEFEQCKTLARKVVEQL